MTRRILFFLCSLFFSLSVSAQSAYIQNVRIERNVPLDGGRRYFKIHTSLDISGLRGERCSVAAYVFDEDGDKILSTDSWYKAPDGQACAQTYVTPSYNSSHWDDIVLCLPNEAIDAYSFAFNYYIAVAVFYAGRQIALYDDLTDYNSFSIRGSDNYAYAPLTRSKPSTSNSYSSNSSSSSSSSSGSAVGALAGAAAVGAAIYGLYKLFSDDDSSSSSSSASSSSSSSKSSGYYTKKYSSEGVARLLSSGGLYACRFKEGSNMTRIDDVTSARITNRGGSQYISLPNRIGGEYKLEHGYSHTLNGGVIYMNEGGDNWYLMDPQKNIILY